MEPEIDLWNTVLAQAVMDARALVRIANKDPGLWANPLFRSEARHIKQYFMTKSMEPGGFGFICDLIGMNPEQAAQRIHEKYLQHLTPIT